ncbi:hypothetical protein ACPCAJ_21125 [Streptomyces griseoincarnatus]
MTAGLVVWPLAVLLAAAGLCVIAPPRSRDLYFAPVGCTTAFIVALAALAVALAR